MLDFSQLTFKSLAVHRVGNKLREEGVLINKDLYGISDEGFRQVLLDYFLLPFKKDEFYRFGVLDNDLNDNVLRQLAAQIFEDKNNFYDHSIDIAKHLYKQSNHAKIKSGELYITYFSDCIVEDEVTDGIGIFKSENKYDFLKPQEIDNQIELKHEKGINIKKLDKGCLIFNTEKSDGFRVLIVDKQSRNDGEALYWKTDFLGLQRVHDNSFNTQNYMIMCQSFCEDVVGEDKSQKDQVLFLNKSLNYFTEHELFDLEDFATDVIESPKQITAFKEFKNQYELDNGFVTQTDFKISQPTVKSMKRQFKKIIELDTNIEIKLTSEAADQYIERGYDEERKMYFYKVYFSEEN